MLRPGAAKAVHGGVKFAAGGGHRFKINGSVPAFVPLTGLRRGGRIVSGDPLLINGGLVSGHGILAGDLVMLGGVAAPGNSPGTLRVMGDMVLGSGSTLALEMARDGRHDRLQVDGRLTIEPGATVRLSFLGGAPDVDQTFQLLSVGAGPADFGGAQVVIDQPGLQSTRYDYYPDNASGLALAFQPASAQRFDRSDDWASMNFEPGETHYADTFLGTHPAIWVGGTLGLRASAALTLARAEVAPGGRLLNSGKLTVLSGLTNHGETINRSRMRVYALDNHGQFVNRGDLTIGDADFGGGSLVNRGKFSHVAGTLRVSAPDDALLAIDNAAGAEMRLAGGQVGRMALANRGRVIVERGGVLLASTLRQDAGELQVDGELTADLTALHGGVLAGSGVLRGAVRIDDAAVDNFGLRIGTLLRPGLGAPDGTGALRFEGPVHLATVFQGVTVELDIASAEAYGQLNFLDTLTVEPGTRLQLVLIDGFVPQHDLLLPMFRFDPERTGYEELGELLGTAEVWQRTAAGDVHWQGGSWTFAWQTGHIDLQLTPTPVPEPATWGLMAGGLALVQWLAWRRRRNQARPAGLLVGA